MKAYSIFLGLLAGLLFGLATPISKLALSHLNSFQLAGLLYLGAAVAFFPYILKNREKEFTILNNKKKRKYLLGITFFGGIIGPVLLMLGLSNAHSTSVSIWLNMELVATAVIGVLFFKDHLGKYASLGVMLTLSASIIISSQEGVSGIISALFVSSACISWAIDNHLTAIIDGVSPQTTTFIKGLVGGTVNLIIGMFLSGWQISLFYILIALLIGIFSYGLSIYLYVTSAQNLGATRSQILFSSAPFWGILGAALFLGDTVQLYQIIALVFLLSGILLSTIQAHKHLHLHTVETHIHLHSHNDLHHNHSHADKNVSEVKHTHIHEHVITEHEHEHFPDMHHRHNHSENN